VLWRLLESGGSTPRGSDSLDKSEGGCEAMSSSPENTVGMQVGLLDVGGWSKVSFALVCLSRVVSFLRLERLSEGGDGGFGMMVKWCGKKLAA